MPSWDLARTPRDTFMMTDAEIERGSLSTVTKSVATASPIRGSALCSGGNGDCMASTAKDPEQNTARMLGAYPDPAPDVPDCYARIPVLFPTGRSELGNWTQTRVTFCASFRVLRLMTGLSVRRIQRYGHVRRVQAAGYKMARGVDDGYNARDFQPYAMHVQTPD